MIPGTLLEVAALAEALGPGYLYVRGVERHVPRAAVSQLSEFVEMLVIGGLGSLISASIVLAIGDVSKFLDTDTIAKHPGEYLLTEPLRTFPALLAFYAISYGGALLAARHKRQGQPPAVYPGQTGWYRAMKAQAPAGCDIHATAELRDGRKIVGNVWNFTSDANQDNREVTFISPIGVQVRPGTNLVRLDDTFLTVREKEIVLLSGMYIDRITRQQRHEIKLIT